MLLIYDFEFESWLTPGNENADVCSESVLTQEMRKQFELYDGDRRKRTNATANANANAKT